MTIFAFHAGPHIPNIGYMRVYEVTGLGRYLIFFLMKFPVECRQNHVWRPIFDPSYDHIYKNVHFVTLELGDTHG